MSFRPGVDQSIFYQYRLLTTRATYFFPFVFQVSFESSIKSGLNYNNLVDGKTLPFGGWKKKYNRK